MLCSITPTPMKHCPVANQLQLREPKTSSPRDAVRRRRSVHVPASTGSNSLRGNPSTALFRQKSHDIACRSYAILERCLALLRLHEWCW